MSKIEAKNLARYFDHTLLKAGATEGEIRQLCQEARTHNFYSVCVNPRWIPLCRDLLRGSSTLPITVVGFPLGADGAESKAFTTRWALEQGAQEIDMVLDIGAALGNDWSSVKADIATVRKACEGYPLKVILETALLNEEAIRRACELCVATGADFVKTSTGFASAGASLEHVRLMRSCVGPQIGVKASGGIRDLASCLAMIEAGANRIGTSSGVKILEECS
jgi:deoxyribose-phosphate aldolase